MRSKFLFVCLAGLSLLLLSCQQPPIPPATGTPNPAQPTPDQPDEAEPTPEPEPTEDPALTADPLPNGIFISEIMAGIDGNNNFEFIELINLGETAVDLNGYTLWYQIKSDENPVPVYRWEQRTDIPAYGHLLLARAGEDIGVKADGLFDEPLFAKGALILRNSEREDIDIVGWGEAPDGSFQGTPAARLDNNVTLERQPADGLSPSGNYLPNVLNAKVSGDNSADFAINATPSPQNTGDAPYSTYIIPLTVELSMPESVAPGEEFVVTISLNNYSYSGDDPITVHVPIPDGFTAPGLESIMVDGRLENQTSMQPNEAVAIDLRLVAPYSYDTTIFNGAYIEADGRRSYAQIQNLAIEGGSVPIVNARDVTGQRLTIEGVATMYTDGFYAGSTGVKFYIEDETGGVQVYVPGGKGDVDIQVGDVVRVTGELEVYRTSLEMVPDDYAIDIEIVDQTAAPAPVEFTVVEAEESADILGRLAAVSGTVTRVEEFSFSYEVDLTDEEGNSTLIYIDKVTEIDIEPVILGEQYLMVGISESFDGNRRLMPRSQGDIEQVFPPVLRLETTAPTNISDSEIPYEIRVINNTAEPMTNIIIELERPTGAVSNVSLAGGVEATEEVILWSIEELQPNGGSARIELTVQPDLSIGDQIFFGTAIATADQWPENATGPARTVFLGEIVPIWAIQGAPSADSFDSPYVRLTLPTAGVVTAVFPGFNGFWIQTPDADDNPATSEGLFVQLEDDVPLTVEVDDVITLNGKVRELSGQTTLSISAAEDIVKTGTTSAAALPVITLNPPLEADAAALYFEQYEGMLVRIPGRARAIAPTNAFGEYAVVHPDQPIERIVKDIDDTGAIIFVDDGSTVRYESAAEMSYTVTHGDLVSGIIGPLAYTFGQYKVEPLSAPVVEPGSTAQQELPSITVPAETFSIATFNVENFFDTRDPHPTNPPQPSVAEYEERLTKLADAIMRMGAPTLIGLQEVENIGVLEDLAAHPDLADYAYTPFLIEGTDSRGIDVAYLMRSDQAEMVRVEQFDAPDGLTSRPPIMIELMLTIGEQSQQLIVLNNHFTSMSGGEVATEPRRNAQAAWNVSLLGQITRDAPDALIAIIGDLNSFYEAKPIATLRNSGLRHVYELTEENGQARPYTYIFEGQSETLDHILVNEALYAQLVDVSALHINADYPLSSPGDVSAQRVSDHDPLIAIFALEPQR